MDLFLVIGTIGMLMILSGFLLIQTHRLTADALLYDVLNCIGSALLVISAWSVHIWPFVILNAVFAVYSLKDILFSDLKKKGVKVVRKG